MTVKNADSNVLDTASLAHTSPALFTAQNPIPVQAFALTPRQRRGVFWAGAVGFNLIAFGGALFGWVLLSMVFPFGAYFLSAFVALDYYLLFSGALGVIGFFQSLAPASLALIRIVIVIVCILAVMMGSGLLSKRILRAHGVNQPWRVTGSGAGIALLLTLLLAWIPFLITILFGMVVRFLVPDQSVFVVISGIVGLALAIATNAVIGWLAWWWMAHLFRPPSHVDDTTTSNTQE